MVDSLKSGEQEQNLNHRFGVDLAHDFGGAILGLTVGELRNGTDRVETSNTIIGYVPSHSERAGGLFFKSDPRQYQLQLRAKGYEKP